MEHYAYNALDNLTQIVRGDGLKYALNYNAFGQLETIGINGKEESLVKYSYKTGGGRLKQLDYANGDCMKATYNGLGQIIAEIWQDKDENLTAHYKYSYDSEGNIVRSVDICGLKEYNYLYEDGVIKRSGEYDVTVSEEIVTAKTRVNTIQYYYDGEGALVKKCVTFADGTEQIAEYENPEEGNTIAKLWVDGKAVTSHSKNDSFGRTEFEELQLGAGVVSRRFDYLAGKATDKHIEEEMLKSTPTTQLVSEITLSDGRTLAYEYDEEERITKVIDSLEGVTEYTYDELGQLLCETVNGEIINQMTYDNYGNILTKDSKAYTYDTVWKDLLVKVGNKEITYDEQGNPLTYLGHNLTWEKGRQLKSFDNIQYTYNANGIRNSKTVDGVRHDFVLDGVKILKETYGSHTIETLYDNTDTVCGIIYNGTPYYFLKNLQGDVISITDQTGTVVANYTYDAWGKVLSISGDNIHIGAINPYRYRGYYYDSEVNMYYLQSRYYDAEVGRFINADVAEFAVFEQTALGHNLFCYCGNDIINMVDFTGYATTSYGGITCNSKKYGFSVKMHPYFLLKLFCKKYAEHIISVWGKNKKYCDMKATRIAAELFAHAVLFVLGIVVGTYSIKKLTNIATARPILSKVKSIIKSAISGYVAYYLIDHSKSIEVNNNEVWYRVVAFWVIWGFFAPIVL